MAAACSGSDEKNATERAGSRGESCQTRADCGEDLACIRGTCSDRSFELTPTEKACISIQCRADSDCCEPSSYCEDLRRQCAAGDDTACDATADACACPFRCEDDRCVEGCSTDEPCSS